MAITLYLSTAPSDLSAAGAITYGGGCRLYTMPGFNSMLGHSFDVPAGNYNWQIANFYTEKDILKKESWVDGEIELKYGIAASAGSDYANLRCIAHRVNEHGTIQESTEFSPVQIVEAQVTYTLTIPYHTWNHVAIADSDRFMLQVQLQNTSGSDDLVAQTAYTGSSTGKRCILPFNVDLGPEVDTSDLLYSLAQTGPILILYRSNVESDLDVTPRLWNRSIIKEQLDVTDEVTLNFAKGATEWQDAYDFVDAGLIRVGQYPDSDQNIQCRLWVTTADANVEWRVSAQLVDQNGVVKETGDWSAGHIFQNTGDASLNAHVPVTTWGIIENTDRIRLNSQFRNNSGNMTASIIIQLAGRSFTFYQFNKLSPFLPEVDISGNTVVDLGTQQNVIACQGAIVDKGDYEDTTFEGSFRYKEGELLTEGSQVKHGDYSTSLWTTSPADTIYTPWDYSSYARTRVSAVKIDSNIRGTIYNVGDDGDTNLKDKTSTVVGVYRGEVLTVSVGYSQNIGLFNPSVSWANSMMRHMPTKEFDYAVTVGSKSSDLVLGLNEMEPWTVPSDAVGVHLGRFVTDAMNGLRGVWLLTFHILDVPYYDGSTIYDEHKETLPALIGQDNLFSDSTEIVVDNSNYIIQGVLDFYNGETLLFTYRTDYIDVANVIGSLGSGIGSGQAFHETIPPLLYNITFNIKDIQNNPLGSANLSDIFTETEWNQGIFNFLVIENGKLRLKGGL